MPFCPKHVEDSVVSAKDRFHEIEDEFHHYFQIVCNRCESIFFRPLKSDKCSIKAVCAKCANEILIYDLAFYPAAVKLKGEEIFSPLEIIGAMPIPIFVGYEYGEFEPDEDFDQNDITWCEIFTEQTGSLIRIFDDETV